MSIDSARILVVDDNPAGRYSTSHVLRSTGWTVLEAATGSQALSLLTESVDLVVLDVNLPDIDGFEVCRRIRSSERTARVPVIHLSATFVTDVYKVTGLEAGADGYLVHPVEPPVLIATVKAFLRARRAEEDRERLLVSERAARAEAERANVIKDEFLATLSHELRTPLQAIIGWTQLLKLGSLSAEDKAKAIGVIERNAQVQTQMIADLLDTSRIISGKLRLEFRPVDPAAMIEAALNAIAPVASAKNVQITRSLDSAAGPVMGDATRLQQVVWNLTNNAVKFTPSGGRIDVGLRRTDSRIEISVADNGLGIDGELLTKIFDRFQQGDASTTRTHGGLGLGLAIAKQLVELHGGQISAESAGAGQGAKFTISLPLSSSLQSPGAQASRPNVNLAGEFIPPEVVLLDGVRVLLVDDDPDAREMLRRALQNSGAVIQDSTNMSDALYSLRSFNPQVLLSDLGMPDHDGFELIRKIRGMGLTANDLPAIALTAFAGAEDRQRTLLAGFQVHISKPVDPREIVAAIADLLGYPQKNKS